MLTLLTYADNHSLARKVHHFFREASICIHRAW